MLYCNLCRYNDRVSRFSTHSIVWQPPLGNCSRIAGYYVTVNVVSTHDDMYNVRMPCLGKDIPTLDKMHRPYQIIIRTAAGIGMSFGKFESSFQSTIIAKPRASIVTVI